MYIVQYFIINAEDTRSNRYETLAALALGRKKSLLITFLLPIEKTIGKKGVILHSLVLGKSNLT
jgi:hypothetical protein